MTWVTFLSLYLLSEKTAILVLNHSRGDQQALRPLTLLHHVRYNPSLPRAANADLLMPFLPHLLTQK